MGGLIRNWSNNIFWTIVLAAAPTNLASSHLYQWKSITGKTKVPITQNLKSYSCSFSGQILQFSSFLFLFQPEDCHLVDTNKKIRNSSPNLATLPKS